MLLSKNVYKSIHFFTKIKNNNIIRYFLTIDIQFNIMSKITGTVVKIISSCDTKNNYFFTNKYLSIWIYLHLVVICII